MPQASNIVINDGSATPVAFTFAPIGKDAQGVFWWEQVTPAPINPIAAVKISYRQERGMRSSKQLNSSSKAVYAVWVPTAETLANNSAGIVPAPTLAYEEKARVEFTLAERSTAAERKNTRVFIQNLLASAMAVANIDTLQPTYA